MEECTILAFFDDQDMELWEIEKEEIAGPLLAHKLSEHFLP